MNSLQKSIMVVAFGLVGLGLGLGLGCARSPKVSEESETDSISEEYRLKEDRTKLDSLRSEVPEEVQDENDELALVLNLFVEKKKEPYLIREKWSTAVRKKRDLFNKTASKERETYNKDTTKKREKFLENLQKSRAEYLGEKHSREEKKGFFDEQDSQRREFFSEQSESRKEFEAQMTERRKNFEDYIKEKSGNFEGEYKNYTRDFYESKKVDATMRKIKEREKGEALSAQPTPDPDLREFENIPKGNKILLGTPPEDK